MIYKVVIYLTGDILAEQKAVADLMVGQNVGRCINNTLHNNATFRPPLIGIQPKLGDKIDISIDDGLKFGRSIANTA